MRCCHSCVSSAAALGPCPLTPHAPRTGREAEPLTTVPRLDLERMTQGKHGEAVEVLEEVLARRTGALGVDHVDTISSRLLVDAVRREQARSTSVRLPRPRSLVQQVLPRLARRDSGDEETR